ncbi:peroxidase family protein [Mycoplana ramosa]|uniref:Peroxidase family protein n=1 Tax=Mycoplana ramosa TaxID=40837 RepID=A0ABW3YUT5_MYCRA
MVQLVKHDLEFILKQIKTAEANSVAHDGPESTPLTELVSHDLLPYGLRTVDGSYNNLIAGQEWNGAADQIMPRLLNPKYVPADHRPAGAQGPGSPASPEPTHYGNTGDVWDADPRIISNLISDQSPDNPAIKALIAQGKAQYVYGTATRIEAEDFTNPGAFFRETISGTSGNTVIRLGPNQSGAASTNVSSNEAASVFNDIKIAYLDENDGAIPMELWVDGKKVGNWMLDAPNQPGDGAQAANLRTITFENVKIGPESVVELRATASTLELARIDYIEMTPKTVMIDNVSADLGDTAPFNGFFTLFGQFFDHGLDLVSKGDNGTVYIPLQPDDPLYVDGSHTNFMVLTRATPVMGAGADGELGTDDDVLLGHRNETTPWIDLNQVYTSNPSHQVFLREYTLVDGKPVATGRMLEGQNGGPATWADVKEQAATKLGILLTDMDILRVPGLLTDVYGEFVRGENGFPQLVTANGFVEGNLADPITASDAMSAGRAFLNDIAHNAAPGMYDLDHDGVADGIKAADDDSIAGNPIIANQMGVNTTYDNELLDRHVIVGDGRGNENIGLTSIHHVFHSEHNRIIDETKKIALESGDLAFLNEWLAVDVTQIPTTQAEIDALVWDGERLFQAGRFTTEMVYQHLVFEEFARAVAPDVDPFLFSNSTTVSGAIVAEFAHVVYRFGHSMLTETIDMVHTDAQGNPVQSDIGLIEAFLNPLAFGNAGINPNEAAGAILNGMSRQVGNEIDEFLTGALRNNLVGLPLDLGATNIARARETGVPSLNEARKQFFADTQDTRVKPYESWYDFALSLKNTASVINFIAAYGTHASITAATTLEAKRTAATLLVMGGNGAPADRLDFLHGQGAYGDTEDGRLGGLNDVDFWIGGLAEKKMTFGSMLGSTFTYVFEYQMEQLQAGDRFYYLSRTQGLNLLNELEADSFAQLIMRNTSLGDDRSTHINGAAFQTADHILEIERHKQIGDDPLHDDPILGAISPMVIRKDTNNDGIVDYLRYTGTDHVVLGGSNRGETLIGGDGDDTLWGDGGDDYLEGGYGVDHLHGGDGDDIIVDSGTDIGAGDVIHGDAGNDVINPGSGLDLVFGGSGQDFIYGGTEAKDISGGLGNDFIRGGTGINFLKGNEGDDWIEGGESFDTLAGENSELFFNSTIIGHDVLNGRGNDNDYDAESGDDIMFQNEGIERNNGMAGFDWAIHKGHNQAADSDMTITIFQNQQNNILRDRFDLVEGLSGWKLNDKLTGRDVVMGAFDANGNAAQIGPDAPLESYSNALLEKNLHLVDGLADLVAHLERFTLTGADGKTETAVMNTDDASDILLGGGGSDTIKGGGGNDIIDGDKWLNVRIRIVKDDVAYTADGMDSKIYLESDYMKGEVVDGATAQFGGKTLQQTMFDRTLNPGQLSIVREIVDGGKEGDVDVAVYWDVRENYSITRNADGSITVEHVTVSDEVNPTTGGNRVSDGIDRLTNIEVLRFKDQEITLSPPKLMLNAYDAAGNYRDNFSSSNYGNTNGSLNWGPGWAEQGDGNSSPTAGQIRITGGTLQFGQGGGATITRTVNLSAATDAKIGFTTSTANLEPDEQVIVWFSRDGSTFEQIGIIDGGSPAEMGFYLKGPFTVNAAIRFVASNISSGNEFVRVDNLSIDVIVPAASPTEHHAASFTENGNAVPIASLPGIEEDSGELVSARIVLTNSRLGDSLIVGALPAGISATVDESVEGRITVTLSGTASTADYQMAIQAIFYRSTSDNPGNQDRVIDVTVNDGILDSNVARTTISVTPVNDRPVAVGDNVITNVANNTAFLVPEWALLANDSDPEGSPVSITGNPTQVNSLNVVRSGGSFSVTDTQNSGGRFDYNITDGSLSSNNAARVTVTTTTSDALNGTTANDIIVGNGNANAIDAGTGDDIIFAGGGNDTITWNANNNGATDGRDFVDGGTNTAVGDRFVVNGNNTAEAFVVYSKAAAVAAGIAVLRDETEIVITRNGAVIAELDNIEEITINTGAGNDTVSTVGDFGPTSLNFNTITINGDGGDDTVDISALASAHRIYFRSNGGNDTIIGTLRSQDVVELPYGRTIADYEVTIGDDGRTTLVGPDGQTITFFAPDGMPTIGGADDDDVPYAGGDDDDVLGGGDDDDDDAAGEDDGNTPTDDDDVILPPVSRPVLVGTPAADVLTGGADADTIIGFDGDDVLIGGGGADVIRGGAGDDFIDGGTGRDVIFAGAGNDDVLGGADADIIYGEAGDDRILSQGGDDLINAGAGNDTVFGGEGNDLFVAEAGDGNDTYYGDDMHGGTGNDTLDMSAITVAITADLGTGYLGRGSVTSSQTGSDTLWSVENIITGSGDDTITASAAVNVMDGGTGNDTFRFLAAADADGDTILGFQPGDRLDLSSIDADGAVAGNQSFTLVSNAITDRGQLLVTYENREDGDYTVVSGNTSGSTDADFKISIKGTHSLTGGDFNL